MFAHDFDSYLSPSTTPVQDYQEEVYSPEPPEPPKIWDGSHHSAFGGKPLSTASFNTSQLNHFNDNNDDTIDLPDTWYEVCSLYCTQCKHFEFAGNQSTEGPMDPSLVPLASVFNTVKHPVEIIAAASGESIPSAPTTTTTAVPSILPTASSPNPITPSSSPSRSTPTRSTATPKAVRRRHCIGSPTLCCLPVGNESKSSVHLRCPKTPITTRTLRAKGCRRCSSSSDHVRVLKIRVQLAEMQYGCESIKNLPNEIAHSLLVCKSCCAIGFPGCSDRLTVIHEKHSHSSSHASSHSSSNSSKSLESTNKSSHLFFDTVSRSALSINAWLSAFIHLPDCQHIHGDSTAGVSSLPIRLCKNEMLFACKALRHTTPLDQRPLAILEAEAYKKSCRLEFSLRQSDMAKANDQTALNNSCVRMTHFILSMRESPLEIFGCRALEMRVRICEMMRRKRKTISDCWSREVAKKFGILLRVFNTLCDEESMEEE